MTHLFSCPEYLPSSTHPQAKLHIFITYALHQRKLHQAVTFTALILLQCLKACFPTASGSLGHQLFNSALMIASEVICDTTCNKNSWFIIAQGTFNHHEINQIEHEMCLYLDWDLTIDNTILTNFMAMVVRDFRGPGPYLMYSLQVVMKKPIPLNPSITALSTSVFTATAGCESCDTPSSCSSASTSPTSSMSPPTPLGISA